MKRAALILVVGMHRSGTSLLGSILQALDVDLPGPLIGGDQHNPEGYFEHSDVTALQEELLIDLKRWWPSESGTQPLPDGWLTSPRGRRAVNGLRRLLADDLARRRGPWAIKDPRSSLLLPLWREVTAELHLPLRLVLALRDPAEVVTSLLHRDGVAAGMTPGRAQALWLRHHQQLLADAHGLPLQVVSYSRWFDDPRPQLQALQRFCHQEGPQPEAIEQALACIRPQHRHCHGRPVRLRRRVHRWHQRLARAAATGDSATLQRWAVRQRTIAAPWETRARTCVARLRFPQTLSHPWSRAVGALGSAAPEAMATVIQLWEQQGIPPHGLQQLATLQKPGLPAEDPSSGDGPVLPRTLQLALIGSALEQWSCHLWIDRLPLSPGTELVSCGRCEPADAALHLQPLAETCQDPALLLHLSQLARVFDPDPLQVRQLRLLGVNAERLGPARGAWLEQPGDIAAAAAQLGLPNPAGLKALGGHRLCLGASDAPGWLQLPEPLLHLPVFPPAPALSGEQARLLASWISACRSAGLTLVRLDPTATERPLWDSLAVPVFARSIEPHDLLAELAWREAGRPEPDPLETPAPAAELLWHHDSDTAAEAAICISSYNYAKRLPAALISCHAQTLKALELLIVDDASSDGSVQLCHHWLEQHGHRFCRVRLLRHPVNSGLAAARNTAFAAAAAPWCLVLDADNQLDPHATERCLRLADVSPERTAVVHPLIRIVNDADRALGLVGGGHPWQRQQLQAGNVVDAMALVRRSAWQSVGGFSHIPDGWEDFDFWCKLIENGWHGVLCPQPLATYNLHDDSMLQSHTNRHQSRLSRLMRHRHPWLRLALSPEGR